MAQPRCVRAVTLSPTSGLLTPTGGEAASVAAAAAALAAAQESMSASAVHTDDAPIPGTHEGGVVAHPMGVLVGWQCHRINIGLLLDKRAKFQLV